MGAGIIARTACSLQFLSGGFVKIVWKNCEQLPFSPSMRALLQRVSSASVAIDGETVSSIGPGFLILLGISGGDDGTDIAWLCPKVVRMRVFPDDEGKMNRSILDAGGDVLVVSQFTLHASTKKGNRPSFQNSAEPAVSEPLYESFCEAMSTELGEPVARGIFGAGMKVSLTNDGPVTIWLDSRNRE
jgi:D-tyrosyl-tRNA(Tyr) deacylase